MILLSILVFVLVAIDFIRDLAQILREYPTLKQFYGTKGVLAHM